MSITDAVISETTGATNFADGAWGYGTTITVSPGVSRLVVLAGCHGSAANMSGVRLGGAEATTFLANNNGYNRSAAVATFSSPAAGTVAIRARFGASVGANVSLVVIEVFGDDASALRTSTSISRQLVTSAPITLSGTASGDRVFAVAVEQSVGAMSASAPAVEEYQVAPGGTDAASFISQDGDDTSTTVTWTSGANARFVLVGVAVMPSSGASTTRRRTIVRSSKNTRRAHHVAVRSTFLAGPSRTPFVPPPDPLEPIPSGAADILRTKRHRIGGRGGKP